MSASRRSRDSDKLERTLKDESREQVISCFGSLRLQSMPSERGEREQVFEQLEKGRLDPYRYELSDLGPFQPELHPSVHRQVSVKKLRTASQRPQAHPVVPDVNNISVRAGDHVRLVPIKLDLGCRCCRDPLSSVVISLSHRRRRAPRSGLTVPGRDSPDRFPTSPRRAIPGPQVPRHDPSVHGRSGKNFRRAGRPIDVGDGAPMTV